MCRFECLPSCTTDLKCITYCIYSNICKYKGLWTNLFIGDSDNFKSTFMKPQRTNILSLFENFCVFIFIFMGTPFHGYFISFFLPKSIFEPIKYLLIVKHFCCLYSRIHKNWYPMNISKYILQHTEWALKRLLKFGGQTMCQLQWYIFINSLWRQSIAKNRHSNVSEMKEKRQFIFMMIWYYIV